MSDAFKISNFVSELDKLGGPLGSSLFSVEFTMPAKVRGGPGKSRSISILCDGFGPPGLTVATDDSYQPYGYGPTRRYVWGAVFTDLQMDFIVDAKGTVIGAFRDWIDSVIHYNTKDSVTAATSAGQPFFVSYRDDYTTDITTYVHDAVGRKVIKTVYVDAYPYRTNLPAFNNSAANTYAKLSVTFSFSRFYEEIIGLDEDTNSSLERSGRSIVDEINQSQTPITQQQAINLNQYMNVAITPIAPTTFPPLVPSSKTTPDAALLRTGGAWGMTSQLPLADPDFDTDSLFPGT